jgi:hypothetical protein
MDDKHGGLSLCWEPWHPQLDQLRSIRTAFGLQVVALTGAVVPASPVIGATARAALTYASTFGVLHA